tara:strand:- start:338 stop:544 length:207 start_codon:yes stop_codon:yes gene_type:complete
MRLLAQIKSFFKRLVVVVEQMFLLVKILEAEVVVVGALVRQELPQLVAEMQAQMEATLPSRVPLKAIV